MFTYFYCLQVSELSDIPEGMMGFSIPAATYAAVHYEGPHPMGPDPYETLAKYRSENGIEAQSNAMVLERYRFEHQNLPEGRIKFDVYGAIKV